MYDPSTGNKDSEIAPHTQFKELPKNWKCPGCGCEKDLFEVVEEKENRLDF